MCFFFFFKQKTAYEIRPCDWSSDVCSSDLIGAGDAPFLIPKTYHPSEVAFVSSGAILPVSDYVNLMPNFRAKVKKWRLEPEIDAIRQSDGKYYLLPGLHEKVKSGYSMSLRTDILDKHGLTLPTTWDEV